MRIAFVVHDYNRTQGHSRYVVELAERLAADHDVHVFANRFEDLPRTIRGHHVPAIRASMLLTIFSFIVPATIMVGSDFDIVHAQGLSMVGANIVTAHISNAAWLEARKQLEGDQLSWRERLFGALVIPPERWILRDPRATVIAISKALKDDLARLYGRTGHTAVVPHGVDGRQFHTGVRAMFRDTVRAELGLAADQVLFLYVGDLRKGFTAAIRALRDVPGAQLAGVSRTAPEPFRTIAAECGVAARVRLLPPTDHVERYYAASDAFVLPTPYDAFGLVITEAMACGLPVITTPLAGASELLTPGVDGLLVSSPADIDGLAAAMGLLATNTPLRTTMGAAAAELMQAHTWDRVADRTLEVYRDHLDRQRQPA